MSCCPGRCLCRTTCSGCSRRCNRTARLTSTCNGGNMQAPTFIKPEWPAPATVAALCTTRVGGCSEAPFDSFNRGGHGGDAAVAVAANRQRLLASCAGLSAIGWLQQVHGVAVVDADPAQVLAADAQFTRATGLGCAVMTADCLPVLLCDRAGTQVDAAHAGWSGLGAGELDAIEACV